MINIYEPNLILYKHSALNAIEEGWISNHGKFIQKSTNLLKEILNVPNVILMSNGTCATHCLFLALKFKYPNINKIYIPNNVYVAAWNALLMVYDKSQVEVMKMDENTWNIDTNEEYIRSLDNNSAVLIVHNLGNIINVPYLKNIRPDLIFIEDNCEGFTGKYNNIYSGCSESSLCSALSFYGNKIITTGEGGAFITHDKGVFDYINKAYSQGMSDERYIHDTHAYNYRMTNIEAAFLYDQLLDFNNIIFKKKDLFNRYDSLFEPLIQNGYLKKFKIMPNTENACWIYGIRIVSNKKSIKETFEYFKSFGVDTRPFFYPINKHKHLNDISFNDNTSLILNNEIIMIPSSPLITQEEQKYIVKVFEYFIDDIEYNIISKDNLESINLLKLFLNNEMPDTFRYFKRRSVEILENHILTIIITEKGIPIGYAHIDYDKEQDRYWLGICILNNYQGKGFGSHLMKFILTHNSISHLKVIHLSVDNINLIAKKMYLNNGFKEIYNNNNFSIMRLEK